MAQRGPLGCDSGTVPASFDLAADLALRLASAHDDEVDAVVTDALAALAREIDAPRSYITLYHDDGTFENSHEWTLSEVVPQRPVIQHLRTADFPYSAGLAADGRVMAVPDLDALPKAADAERRSFSAFGVRSVLQVPIVVNDESIGLIGFNYFEPQQGWNDEFVHFVHRVGQVIGVVLLRQQARAARRLAYEEISRANALKDAFLSHVSHELRTPLHAILGYAELLGLEDRSDADHKALQHIQSNGRYLLTMVEDLIALSQHGSDGTRDVPLGPLVTTTLETLGSVATSHHVSVDVTNAVHGIVVHDEVERLRQVLYCVVSAAMQSVGDGGALRIDAEVEPTTAQPTVHVRLEGAADLSSDELSMPMAHALINGHGTVDIVQGDRGVLEISVRFGRSDDAQTDRP